MVLEVRIVVIWGRNEGEQKETYRGFWDAHDVLLLGLGVGYTGVFILGKLIKLTAYDLCTTLLYVPLWPVSEH